MLISLDYFPSNEGKQVILECLVVSRRLFKLSVYSFWATTGRRSFLSSCGSGGRYSFDVGIIEVLRVTVAVCRLSYLASKQST